MKQIISVRAIVRQDGKTLILRRVAGRDSVIGKYELPGGRIDSDEQPEDALRRHVHTSLGLPVQTSQLFDSISYVDHANRDIQYVVIVYMVSLGSGKIDIDSDKKYDHYVWLKSTNSQRYEMTSLAEAVLDGAYVTPTTANVSKDNAQPENIDVKKAANTSHLIIYSDGGSRGNPGPSAAGFVIYDEQDRVIFEGGEYLGVTTNNQAEYQGVRLGLERALSLNARRIDFRMDSLLVVNQMNGIYKIKNRELWPINERIRELVGQFDKVTFSHVRREFNQLADSMVNKTLDSHQDINSR